MAGLFDEELWDSAVWDGGQLTSGAVGTFITRLGVAQPPVAKLTVAENPVAKLAVA